MNMLGQSLPGRGRWQAQPDGGAVAAFAASGHPAAVYPTTALRAVPLPVPGRNFVLCAKKER